MSMTKDPRRVAFLLLVTLGAVAQAPLSVADGSALREARVLALAPLAGKAILRLPGDGLVLLEEGDEVGETVVVEVLPDRLVLEDRSGDEVSWIWLHKPERPGEPSRLQRISRRNPEKLQVLAAPEWIVLPGPGKDSSRGGQVLPVDPGQGPSPAKKDEGGNGDGR